MDTARRILLAEDEEFVARSYERKLALEGYTVLSAKNGVEALSILEEEKPDLVLLDLMMPLKSGLEVLKEVRESTVDAIKRVPIVVASNLGQQSDIDAALALGAVDFLIKSNISLKELVHKVEEHLPKR